MLDVYGLPGRGITVKVDAYTANGTWTKRDRLMFAYVRISGGGGGGAGGDNVSVNGAGGGGAGYSEKWYRNDELNGTEKLTVGAAGSGGAVSTNGTAGTASTFKALTANGGGGGGGGGAGGTASGGDLNITGQSGATPTFGVGGWGAIGIGGSGAIGAGSDGTAGQVMVWNFIAS